MSANDIITIRRDKDKFVVRHADMEGAYNYEIGQFDTLEEAGQCAKEYERENEYPVEYGIDISEECFKSQEKEKEKI